MTTSHIHAEPARPRNHAELTELRGRELGPTAWHALPQDRVNAFADVTEDHQWIHVDPERAATTDLGGTIAHGLLTLSLGPALSSELLRFDGFAHGLNYGYDKVRFPAPVPVGSRVRMRVEILSADEVPGGIQVTTKQTMEREGDEIACGGKPVMVAVSLSRVVAHADD
ncbi:MaoC family dehydratase [Rhodococcus sp. HNM0569]|uniref:MaoC family dehydratase n=1 Tax=Rhodococcus sp. HNM0569 TaxID=2716340 RepID=UPI00146A5B76|nr:MaoC family dehydratase [Rhodococcus sp. HNM0569]NLU83083.1 MaoC family dehydratase [Rhodococcus sp. HNM0569]